MQAVIEVQGLRKEYRRFRGGQTVAVDGLDLEVPEGGVFGFLGPNGSGKTTTIRCVLGLARPTAGSATVLGLPTPDALGTVLPRVGAIVETPALFPTMTGRENLRLLGAIDRIGPTRVDEVLAFVGLAARADDKVRKYSLGMRQRLGLAAALLKDPELLILDEPANGLDPAGIREIRELLRRLGDEGRTVFVSSIDHGRCILEGRVEDVLASAARPSVLVGLGDPDSGTRVLETAGFAVEAAEHGLLRVAVAHADAALVTKTLADAALYVTELRPETVSLEELFLELTSHSEAEKAEVAA